MIEPGHRDIVDVERQAPFGLAPKCKADGSLDHTAMPDGDHVLACVLDIDPHDRSTDAGIEIHKALATWRRLVDVGVPLTADRTAGEKRDAVHPLPLPEMLLGKGCFPRHASGLREAGSPDRFGGLMRTLEIARIPDGVARQDLGDRLEHLGVAGIALDVLLAVDVAAVAAHRRMTHPPPPRRHHFRFVWIGHPKTLQ